ncbi:kinesin-like protein KIF26B isoform X2 [Denticeps clupeoides]|nr:kinesin-like protein KIF26B isoform X2 [Denticeps clupeoides]
MSAATGYGSPGCRRALCDTCVARLNSLNISSQDPNISGPCSGIQAWKEEDVRCDACATNLGQLKQEALHMILTQEQTIWATTHSASLYPSTLPRTHSPHSSPAKPSLKSRNQERDMKLEGPLCSGSMYNNSGVTLYPWQIPWSSLSMEGQKSAVCRSDSSLTSASMSPSGVFPAVSFLTRVAQKLNISTRWKKPVLSSREDLQLYPNNFCRILQHSPPPIPSHLFHIHNGERETPSTGKVKVMLRICPAPDASQSQSTFRVDSQKKQITVLGTDAVGTNASQKTFSFNAVFSPETTQVEVCEFTIPEILQAVVNGADGCILSFGQVQSGKFCTMIGRDESTSRLGVIPCAISWLFKLINNKKSKTGGNIFVSVSAVEVCGKKETLRDLLSAVDNCTNGPNPDICLFEDPISGIQLQNHSVMSAPTAERAAFLLDAAIASQNNNRPDRSHFFFILYILQQNSEDVMCSNHSRLTLINLDGWADETMKPSAPLSFDLSNVFSYLNGASKQVPKQDSKLAMLLQESLANINCQTTIIAHVSNMPEALSEALSTIQIVCHIRKMQKKAKKCRPSSPDGKSLRKEKKAQHRDKLRASYSSDTLNPYQSLQHFKAEMGKRSASDHSCDTVIHVDPNGHILPMMGPASELQKSVAIIPFMDTTIGEPTDSSPKLKQQTPKSLLKEFRILQRSQEEKETKQSNIAQRQPTGRDCLKCNTFAELQERLGCIDGSDLAGTTATMKSSDEITCKRQVERAGLPNNKNPQQLYPKDNSSFAVNQSKADRVEQNDFCETSATNHRNSSLQLLLENLGGPNEFSSLQSEIRTSPVGKSSPRSSSLFSLSTSTGSLVKLPLNQSDLQPQQSPEGQKEMRATVTVTIQQPLDGSGHDELVYTVVEEVPISGMVERGRTEKVISFADGHSLLALMSDSQPVRIISSISEDACTPEFVTQNETSDIRRSNLQCSSNPDNSESYVFASSCSGPVSLEASEAHGFFNINPGKQADLKDTGYVETCSEYQDIRLNEKVLDKIPADECLSRHNSGNVSIHSNTSRRHNSLAKKDQDTKHMKGKKQNVSLSPSGSSSPTQFPYEFKQETRTTGMRSNHASRHSRKDEAILSLATQRRLMDGCETNSLENHKTSIKNMQVASLQRDWNSLKKQHSLEDFYLSNRNKTFKSSRETASTPCSPREMLGKRQSHAWQGSSVKRKDDVLFSLNKEQSSNQKKRTNIQPSLTRTAVLENTATFLCGTIGDKQNKKRPMSPTEESSMPFNTKLELLANRPNGANKLHSEVSGFYSLEHGNTVDSSVVAQESFECDGFLTQGNRIIRRYPKFLTLDNCVCHSIPSQTPNSNLSKSSTVGKLIVSSHKGCRQSANCTKSQSFSQKSTRDTLRESSLLPKVQCHWPSQKSRDLSSRLARQSSLNAVNGQISDDFKSTDYANSVGQEHSDSGSKESLNEEKNIPSPYNRLTAPRTPSHCSGHASDTTSILSGKLPPAMGKTSLLYNRNSVVSSGYESLMRDSTGSSTSIRDSNSDRSCFHSLARSSRSSRRRYNTGSCQRRPSHDSLLSMRRLSSGPRVHWIDRSPPSSYEIKVYEIDNVDHLQKRGVSGNKDVVCFSAKLKFLEHRQQRIAEVWAKYNALKRELDLAKHHLMVKPVQWTHEFDLWQTFEVDSLEHLEALEMVTMKLESRVNQCKARVMMVTCFDASPRQRQRRRCRASADQKGYFKL